jgi:hypothetical protein
VEDHEGDSGITMHHLSQELANLTDERGQNREGVSQELVTSTYAELFTEIERTKRGKEFLRRGGTTELLVETYRERYSDRPPAVTPVYEALMECLTDLLVTLPEPVKQAAPPPPPKPVVVKEPPKPSSELVQFAHMVEEAARLHGVQIWKPRQGVVTLKLSNDRSYDYLYATFEKLFGEAVSFGLIR